jgi:hypothetical protein
MVGSIRKMAAVIEAVWLGIVGTPQELDNK